MAEPLMNQLLEEATSRATELTGEAGEALAAVSALTRRAESLDETLTRRGEEAQRRFREVGERMDAAAAALQSSGDEAAGALQELDERAAGVRTRVGELTASVRAGLDEMAAAAGRLTAETADATSEACTALEHVVERVGELERELDERLRAAEAELTSFRDTIATAGPRFEEATESFLGALERLSEEAVAQTRATVDGVTHFLEHAADVHNRLTTELVEASNQAVATIQTVFTETVPGQMPAVYAPLAAEFGDLKTQCDDLKEELGSSVEQMVERLAECEGALQLSDTALERAASLG